MQSHFSPSAPGMMRSAALQALPSAPSAHSAIRLLPSSPSQGSRRSSYRNPHLPGSIVPSPYFAAVLPGLSPRHASAPRSENTAGFGSVSPAPAPRGSQTGSVPSVGHSLILAAAIKRKKIHQTPDVFSPHAVLLPISENGSAPEKNCILLSGIFPGLHLEDVRPKVPDVPAPGGSLL